MSSIEQLTLVGASGELPFARETLQLGDERSIVFLGNPESPSWLALKKGEVLVSTHLSRDTLAWLEARLGIPVPGLYALQEPFAVVINPTNTKINILQPNPVNASRLDPMNALEGSFLDELGENGRKADTKIILEQKAAAKQRLAPLIARAIATNHAYSIGNIGQNDAFIVPATEEMIVATTISGDPISQNRKLQKEGSLFDPGTILVVQKNTDKSFSYFSTSVGKASGTDMPKLAVNAGAQTEESMSLAKAIENAVPTGLTATRLRMHLIAKLLTDAQVIYPETPDFEQPEPFSLTAIREATFRGLPAVFVRYLEKWQTEALPKVYEELTGKRIHPDSTKVAVREVGDLTEPIIEWILAASGERGDTQFDRLVVETLSRRTLMERERAIKAAGLVFLSNSLPDGKTIEDIFAAEYTNFFDVVAKMSQGELEEFVTQTPELAAMIAERSRKGKYKLTPGDVAQDMASMTLDKQIRDAGIYHFDENLLGQETVGLNKQRAVRRAERSRKRGEILVTGAVAYEDLLKNAIAVLEEFGGPGALLYETPHTAAMRKELEQLDYPQWAGLAARVPWRMLEAPVLLRSKERFENFGKAWSFASSVARDLYIGAEYVLEKYHIDTKSAFAKQISILSEMVRETADWRMPDFLPRPTREQPGLPMPVMFLRPDFAREQRRDGSILWVATEGEASPGGLGFDVIIEAARKAEGFKSTVLEEMYHFLKTADIPNSVNRNQLTIVMTEEWSAYKKELEVFLAAFTKRYPDISANLISIEDMARNPEIEVQSGFIFHFAYPWNFIKDPATATGEDSQLQAHMAARARELYERQGNDLYIFNDPISGRILHGKMDMAIFHLPGFSETLAILAERSGFASMKQAQSMTNTLLTMTATTIPLVQNTKNRELNTYAAQAVDRALAEKEKWVVKLSMDPNGEEDWGARGIVVGADPNITPQLWKEAVARALTGGLPWVLQRVVDNTPYDAPRQSRAGFIDADDTKQIAFYNRDPKSTVLGIGDLAVEASVKARLNIFLLSTATNTAATTGNMTLKPSEGKVAESIHGMTAAGEEMVLWR